jgi:hypothetical protein
MSLTENEMEAFAISIMNRIREAGETAELKFDKEKFAIVRSDRHYVSLSNTYGAIQEPNADKSAMVENIIRLWFGVGISIPDDYEDAKLDLLVRVAPRHEFEIGVLRAKKHATFDHKLACIPLGNHLAAGLALDFPDYLCQIGNTQLRHWKVDFSDAYQVAKQNLESLVGLAQFEVICPGLYAAVVDENYNSAMLVIPELLEPLQVKGDLIAMVPSRRSLLITGADDIEGLVKMAEVANIEYDKPWSRSGIALRLQDGKWNDFLPHHGHPAYPILSALKRKSLQGAYQEQHSMLQEMHGEEVFVGRYMIVQRPPEDTFSVCIWAEDDLSILPETEVITFCGLFAGRPTIKCVPWEDVVQSVGHLMKPLDVYPKRFCVAEFPVHKQISAMKAHEIQATLPPQISTWI